MEDYFSVKFIHFSVSNKLLASRTAVALQQSGDIAVTHCLCSLCVLAVTHIVSEAI